MQCRECGLSLASSALFCPACGARQVVADPQAAAPQSSVQSPSAVVSSQSRPAPQAAPAKPAASESALPAKAPKAVLPQPGETFAERYRVEKYLGLGSLCNSYLCRDLAAGNREVVLKIMHARKASEAGMASSFIFLAQSVAKYNHKGIAKIFEAGNFQGAPYYTMEWVSGVPLRMWLMERLNFENRVLPGLGIVRILLDTFEAIHELGCYGCVKPENIFITLNGPVIMDFGVVGFLSPQEFEFNSYARRYIPYMAPELRQDWSNLVPHSDFYSLGAILYEILVGRAPAPQLKLPSEMSALFGIEADEIILKSMAPKPLDRFGTLEAFIHAVESLQASLLNAKPQEGQHQLDIEPQEIRPVQIPARTKLDVTTDATAVHNPNLAFTPAQMKDRVPSNSPAPSASQDSSMEPAVPTQPNASPQPPPFAKEPSSLRQPPVANPWTPEPRENPRVNDDDPGARTMLVPSPSTEESDKLLSAMEEKDAREGEEAHAQRRFMHAPQSLPGLRADEAAPSHLSQGNADVTASKWASLAGDTVKTPTKIGEENESDPVPAWLWISLALAGCSLVVLSAYFGLLMPR